MQPDAPLQAGVTLSIPKATLSANSASTFKPYDPSRVIGDANPALSALPQPQADDGGCGGFGEILKLAVIIAVTILTEGATASWAAEAGFAEIGAETATIASVDAAELAASVASGAVSYGAGALAGEVFGVATGMQNRIDWRNVGLAAISGGISGGLSGVSALSGNVVLRAAVASALTQGIGVATGLQKSFSWANVAASAIGAGVGESVRRELSGMGIDPFTGRVLTSAAASTATALARGGRVSITQIGVNAFGQSIGSSLAEQAMMGGTQEDRLTSLYNDGDLARSDLRFNSNAPSYHFATADGLDSGFTGTFGTALPRDSSNDLLVAGGDGFTLGRSSLAVSQSGRTTVIDGTGNPSINSLLSQAKSLADELSAQAATDRALNNLTDLADAYRASGMTGATGDPYQPAVKYLGQDGGLYDTPQPPVVVIGKREVTGASVYGSMEPIGELEALTVFNPVARGIKGFGMQAFDAWTAIPNALRGIATLAGDAAGYAGNAMSPARSVLTGQPFAYQPQSALLQSIQQQGVLGTLGTGIVGAVRNAPGIGLIAALGAPNRNWETVGGQVFNTGAVAAGVLSSGSRSVAGGSGGLRYQTLDEVLIDINRNADIATELTRRALARGNISGSPQAFGTRAHSIYEGLNERLNRRLIGEDAPFRIAVEEFRDPAGIASGRRAAGSIGADVRIFDSQTGTSLRVLDLKTHGGVQIPIGPSRQLDFTNRFGLSAEEIYRLR